MLPRSRPPPRGAPYWACVACLPPLRLPEPPVRSARAERANRNRMAHHSLRCRLGPSVAPAATIAGAEDHWHNRLSYLDDALAAPSLAPFFASRTASPCPRRTVLWLPAQCRLARRPHGRTLLRRRA